MTRVLAGLTRTMRLAGPASLGGVSLDEAAACGAGAGANFCMAQGPTGVCLYSAKPMAARMISTSPALAGRDRGFASERSAFTLHHVIVGRDVAVAEHLAVHVERRQRAGCQGAGGGVAVAGTDHRAVVAVEDDRDLGAVGLCRALVLQQADQPVRAVGAHHV
ncbi:hypothetical protein G6F31_017381 [Rhizopus arrhizus]|nr:hypothetical protein G6F31_017381 [Rhizopus arrhizus]